MKKRNLFDEIVDGVHALKDEREGKITLKRISTPPTKVSELDPKEILALRNKLNLSRAVFAHTIRTNPRTVESWEQGRSKPNAQAVILIKLVEKYPETLQHLSCV